MAESTEPAPPAIQLVTRSRSHGIEIVGGPSGRSEDEKLGVVPSFEGHSGRSIVAVDGGRGSWLCVGGGSGPLEVVETRGGRKVALPGDTAGCERFSFSPLGTFLVTWQRSDAERFPGGSLRVWDLRGDCGAPLKSFHCKVLNKGGKPFVQVRGLAPPAA